MSSTKSTNQITQLACQEERRTIPNSSKQLFTAPKLTFIPPKLVRQGSVEEITADSLLSPNISPGG